MKYHEVIGGIYAILKTAISAAVIATVILFAKISTHTGRHL